jgi:hypothetical protein
MNVANSPEMSLNIFQTTWRQFLDAAIITAIGMGTWNLTKWKVLIHLLSCLEAVRDIEIGHASFPTLSCLHIIVGLATGYALDCRGVGIPVPVGQRLFTLLHFVQTGSGAHPALSRGVKQTTQLQLAPRPRKFGSIYNHSPIRLHGVVLN